MVQEYYAIYSRLTEEPYDWLRKGIEFEAVDAKKLDFFLGKAAASSIDTYEKHRDILRTYQDYGVMDERFRQRKVEYLGETGFDYVTVYFDDLQYTLYQDQEWYLLRISNKIGELTGTIYEAASYGEDTEDSVINSYANLEPMPAPQAKLLKQLYRPYIPKESRAENWAADNILHAIKADTQIDNVAFRYVGAALCVELLDANKNTIAFFDLGVCISNNLNIIAQRPAAELSRAALKTKLLNISPSKWVTIFISHWHKDHCNLVKELWKKRRDFNRLVNYTEWFVPEDTRPIFHFIQNAIPHKNHFHVFSGQCGPINVNDNENIQVGKIDFGSHAHHRGLYVQLLTKNYDGYILLPGDTTYQGLPNEIRERTYEVLQVCHHGGDYHLPPAVQKREDAKQYIPRGLDNAGFAYYSADGIHYRHPTQESIEDHRDAGYTEELEVQLQLIALDGKNVSYTD